MSGPLLRRRTHIRALGDAGVEMLLASPTLNVKGAAQAVGTTESSVYCAWRRRFPGRPPRGRGVTPQMRKLAALPFATLCDAMLDHVPSKPATAAQIFTATLRDYGECCERRLFRALRRLIDTGRVERVGEIYTAESTYRRRTTAMSKKIDREQLKRTALAATQDEWQWQDDGDAIEGKHDGQIVLYADESEADDGPVVIVSVADREHIAAASSPVMLALLARLEELERALDGALALADEPEHNQDARWEAARKAHEETLRKDVVLS